MGWRGGDVAGWPGGGGVAGVVYLTHVRQDFHADVTVLILY